MIFIRKKCQEDLAYWKKNNLKTFEKIRRLIQAVEKTPFNGVGKPEPLKHQFAGVWSRRIDRKNRIIYCVTEEGIWLIFCRGHYE